MSGICDTCKREHCHAKMDGLKSCDFHEGGESNYTRLFGTPEKAARTLIVVREECEDIGTCYPNCPFDDAPACPSSVEPRDYDVFLEWLSGDAE